MAGENVEVQMKDGRTVSFGEKTRMKKEYGVEGGLVFCRLDFSNGETIEYKVDPASDLGMQACGHGLAQKFGDAAAGAETVDDAFESVFEVVKRAAAGEWNKTRESSGGSAKGASELVLAMAKVMGKDKETVRDLLATLSQAEKMALRKVPEIATAIEEIKAEKAPSKADLEKAEKGASLLAALKSV